MRGLDTRLVVDLSPGKSAVRWDPQVSMVGGDVEADEVAKGLRSLAGIEVTAVGDRLRLDVPALGDGLWLRPADVVRLVHSRAPDGDPAVELAFADDVPLIVVSDDVVYEPAPTMDVIDSPIEVRITNMPPLVAYSEMERAAVYLARSGDDADLAELDATFLLVRCFVAGATRFGMRPVRTVAWWLRGSAATLGEFPTRQFRPDPLWDDLVTAAEGTEPPSVSPWPDPSAERTAAAAVSLDDFRSAEPALTAVPLDEELVACWRRWIAITPERFAATVLAGTGGSRARVAVYPDGGGSVEVRRTDGPIVTAVLQLGFSFRTGTLTVEEIRIREPAAGTGLFQRMMFNAEQLAWELGLDRVTFVATGVGRYALATVGVSPRDPGLHRRTGRPR